MKQFLFFVFLFLGSASSGQSVSSSFGKPIFWYKVSDPWSMFMGAEGPLFILYDNGKVIFWKYGTYNLAELNEEEKKQIISDMDLTDTLFQQSRFFNATNPDPNGLIMATDNPSYTISVNLDTLVRISVYGYISSKDYRKRFPKQFLQIHDFVLDFDDDKTVAWVPDKIQVMLSDYGNSPEIPIKWPQNWPDLNSLDTKKQDYVTSIFLDNKYFGQLVKLLKKRKEKQAFEINGKKFFVGYRFPIPGLY